MQEVPNANSYGFLHSLFLSFYVNLKLIFAALLFRLKCRTRILIVGDSHGSFLLHGKVEMNWGQDNFWAFWLGPKLLFSISRDGITINKGMKRTIGIIAPTNILYLFGEIDVRTRLSALTDRREVIEVMVSKYFASLNKFSESYGIRSRMVLEPPPPTKGLHFSADFPIEGHVGDRIETHYLLAQQLKSQSRDNGFKFVPFPGTLIEPDGTLSEIYTDDGCHVNLFASEIWRQKIMKAIYD